MATRRTPRPKSATAPRAAPAAAAEPLQPRLAALSLRVLALAERWLALYEAQMEAAESRPPDASAAPKPPELATLRELVNAATLCVRLRQAGAANPGEGTDADRQRIDLEALERALSEPDR
ncbi:MAG: hypothetical protein SF028_09665 [Candidatus Sumerlaeia bacterium]|nr:hypothetical protein [Candidatus Sumerlaeia bacterium]